MDLNIVTRTRGGGVTPVCEGMVRTDCQTHQMEFQFPNLNKEKLLRWLDISMDSESHENLTVTWLPKTRIVTWTFRLPFYIQNKETCQALHRFIQQALVSKGYRWGVVPGSGGSEFFSRLVK